MLKMGLQGLIFDLDGVIVDTVPLHFKAWKKMFGEYGKDFTFDDYKAKVDGIPRIDGARAILTDLPQDELEKAAEKKQEYYLEALEKEGAVVYEGTLALIRDARKEGMKTAVVSSSKNCPFIVKRAGIDGLFDVIIGGNDVKKGKPDPEMFLTACSRLGFEPAECIVFEDAVLGVEAARRGKFKCVGIDRYKSPERLSKADLVVDDLAGVGLSRLKGFFKP
ncbi:MAG: beta-phosphoglucomutase family hydrolase [Candidatus Omnitrophica bacterium]|nr:beta-phosphoglucomutase family hydrolase [Candidatus Omnitrophota bacterium]